jgi:hypothetical protein
MRWLELALRVAIVLLVALAMLAGRSRRGV